MSCLISQTLRHVLRIIYPSYDIHSHNLPWCESRLHYVLVRRLCICIWMMSVRARCCVRIWGISYYGLLFCHGTLGITSFHAAPSTYAAWHTVRAEYRPVGVCIPRVLCWAVASLAWSSHVISSKRTAGAWECTRHPAVRLASVVINHMNNVLASMISRGPCLNRVWAACLLISATSVNGGGSWIRTNILGSVATVRVHTSAPVVFAPSPRIISRTRER